MIISLYHKYHNALSIRLHFGLAFPNALLSEEKSPGSLPNWVAGMQTMCCPICIISWHETWTIMAAPMTDDIFKFIFFKRNVCKDISFDGNVFENVICICEPIFIEISWGKMNNYCIHIIYCPVCNICWCEASTNMAVHGRRDFLIQFPQRHYLYFGPNFTEGARWHIKCAVLFVPFLSMKPEKTLWNSFFSKWNISIFILLSQKCISWSKINRFCCQRALKKCAFFTIFSDVWTLTSKKIVFKGVICCFWFNIRRSSFVYQVSSAK